MIVAPNGGSYHLPAPRAPHPRSRMTELFSVARAVVEKIAGGHRSELDSGH